MMLGLVIALFVAGDVVTPRPPDVSRLTPYRPWTLTVYTRSKGCVPCVHLKASIGEAMEALAGYQLEQVIDDVDRCKADEVDCVPTMIVRDPSGKIVRRHEGEMNSSRLREWLRGDE